MTELALLPGVRASAVFSPDGRYRYELRRVWTPPGSLDRKVLWIMLNPSVASILVDDRTVRRCQDFSRRWGFGGAVIANVYAYRSPYPADLWKQDDPVGPDNNFHIGRLLQDEENALVVAAWGMNATARRVSEVRRLVRDADRTLMALGNTKDGSPRHPLYVKGETEPRLW